MMNRNQALLAAALLGLGAPAAAQAQAAAAPATITPNVTAGAAVLDAQGGAVGTIESVTGDQATLFTGKNRVQVPLSSFGAGPNGLLFGMTRDQVDTAAETNAKAAVAAALRVGATVYDPQGGTVGTIQSLVGDQATVQTAKSRAVLPSSSFVVGPQGLVIGSTAAQLDAQVAAATGGAATTPADAQASAAAGGGTTPGS
jgi:rRNA processing protein Gar1